MKLINQRLQQLHLTQMEDLLEHAPIAIGRYNILSGRINFLNLAFTTLFGYTLHDLPNLAVWSQKANPTKLLIRQPEQSIDDVENKVTCKDGTVRYVSFSFTDFGDERFWYFYDLSEHYIKEQRLQARSDMLEMVAKSSALNKTLFVIIKQIEKEMPGALCSILLFDATNQTLNLGAAPNLTDDYNMAINGIKIGPNIGSCGTAAYLNERVIVADIATHPYWENFTELAQKAGLRSCWSDPIHSANGELLGTFAIYNNINLTPNKHDLELINFASNLASIAIENHNTHEELERRAYNDYLTDLANRRSFFELSIRALQQAKQAKESYALLMMDVDHFKRINDIYGHDSGDQVLQILAKTSQTAIPKNAILGRIGGEEFAIFLPNSHHKQAIQVAEQLRTTLSHMAIKSQKGERIHYTVSLGVSSCQDKCNTIGELLSEADKALYKAKQTGRNKVCVFSED
ncbi:putative diguanylate cyclase YdaM [Marinomonas spartinae]|uniref:sensor domain-containing diguanylate cyclase n=1 Tax=Marinomonas spartinae TaxID=1792290 RepID=UPI00080901BC|nr:diguanylate cyclase [Marinomonas spartinae]SBS24644.1 putative diguanylate cyclase YdaM [Marinomonas spartinae]